MAELKLQSYRASFPLHTSPSSESFSPEGLWVSKGLLFICSPVACAVAKHTHQCPDKILIMNWSSVSTVFLGVAGLDVSPRYSSLLHHFFF